MLQKPELSSKSQHTEKRVGYHSTIVTPPPNLADSPTTLDKHPTESKTGGLLLRKPDRKGMKGETLGG